ncbi:hypothetical protein ACFQ51_22705 [Streptomyces kaempferi]
MPAAGTPAGAGGDAGGPVTADDLALLADHSEAAGDPTAVLEYAPAAAAHAAATGAHREAAAQYARALRHADRLPLDQQTSLLEGHAQACLLSSRLEEAVESRRTAVRLRRTAGDRLHEGRTCAGCRTRCGQRDGPPSRDRPPWTRCGCSRNWDRTGSCPGRT